MEGGDWQSGLLRDADEDRRTAFALPFSAGLSHHRRHDFLGGLRRALRETGSRSPAPGKIPLAWLQLRRFSLAPSIQALVLDEWRTMEANEALRGKGWSWHRKMKLKGLLAVRSGVKARRVRQNGNPAYSREIAQAARGITGWPLWLAGQALVELRDFYLFRILGRTAASEKHLRLGRRPGMAARRKDQEAAPKEFRRRWPPV